MQSIKKIFKFVSSRALYLLIGLLLSLVIYGAHAAWNSTVSSGQPLTSALWNDVVNKLIELDNKNLQCVQKSLTGGNFNKQTLNCDAGYTLTGGGCVWRSDGNDRYVYSRPNGNGWYCRNDDAGLVSEIWAVCCK